MVSVPVVPAWVSRTGSEELSLTSGGLSRGLRGGLRLLPDFPPDAVLLRGCRVDRLHGLHFWTRLSLFGFLVVWHFFELLFLGAATVRLFVPWCEAD